MLPDPADQPGPRYSMHIHAGEPWPLERTGDTPACDPGMGYVQSGPLFQDTTLHVHPTPVDSDYLGFRCQIGDFVGDSSLDFAFLVLRTRELAFWDGDDLTARRCSTAAHRVRRTTWATAPGPGASSPTGASS